MNGHRPVASPPTAERERRHIGAITSTRGISRCQRCGEIVHTLNGRTWRHGQEPGFESIA